MSGPHKPWSFAVNYTAFDVVVRVLGASRDRLVEQPSAETGPLVETTKLGNPVLDVLDELGQIVIDVVMPSAKDPDREI